MPSIAGIIISAALIGGFIGYKTCDTFNLAEQASILKAEKAKFIEVQGLNSSLKKNLAESLANTKIKYKYITKQVYKELSDEQKTNSNCNITPDTARLLNGFISTTVDTSRESTRTLTRG